MGNSVQHLEKQGVPIEKEFDEIGYIRAAKDGNVDKVRWHLQCKHSDVNIVCQYTKLTALHMAAKAGRVEVAKALLALGADPNIHTKRGNTPVHIAAIHAQLEVLSILLDEGADVNAKSKHGYTPLYMAAMENHKDVVRLLLARGADKTISPSEDVTPLKIAQLQGYDEVVRLLQSQYEGASSSSIDTRT